MNRSPLRSIWLNPTQTVAKIAHENPGYRLYVLPILAGFAAWPTHILFSTDENAMQDGLVLLSLRSFDPLLEILQLFIGAYLLRATGAWFGGNAGIPSIQVAIAWGNVPIVALAVLGVLLLPVAPIYEELREIPLSGGNSPLIAIFAFTVFTIQFFLVAWSFAILLRGLAVVQGYSVLSTARENLAGSIGTIPDELPEIQKQLVDYEVPGLRKILGYS